MDNLKLPKKYTDIVAGFTSGLKDIYAESLNSVIIYGSAASGEFAHKHSNINVLIILNDTDLKNISKSCKLISSRKYRLIDPLFLTEDYIKRSLDVFPIEFLDMKDNYQVIFGKDVLKDLNIGIKNLRFQCEQELKARIINLKKSYLKIRRKADLENLLLKTFTSFIHLLRNLIRLNGKTPAYPKEDVIKEAVNEFKLDPEIPTRILQIRNNKIKLSYKELDSVFIDFTREFDKIADIVDKL